MCSLGAVQVGCIDNEIVINPTRKELQQSQMNLVVAAAEKSKVGRWCSFFIISC